MERERSVARKPARQPVVTRLTPDLTAVIGIGALEQKRKDQPTPKVEPIEDPRTEELKGFVVLAVKRSLLGEPIGLIGINLDIPTTTRSEFTRSVQAESFDQASDLVGLGVATIWNSQPNRTWERNIDTDLILFEGISAQTVVEIGRSQLEQG